jgi:hypothetical protein
MFFVYALLLLSFSAWLKVGSNEKGGGGGLGKSQMFWDNGYIDVLFFYNLSDIL